MLIDEPATHAILDVYDDDPALAVWWATEVECVSALSRRERDGLLTPEGAEDALTRLDALRERWDEIEPREPVRRTARRLLRVHPLRGGDALQLAAALVASEADPSKLGFVSLDERLVAVAQREGFQVVPQQQV